MQRRTERVRAIDGVIETERDEKRVERVREKDQ